MDTNKEQHKLTDSERKEATEAVRAACAGFTKNRKGAGYLVETKHGIGRTFHCENFINGKIPVFFLDGKKILFKPENLKQIGFID